MPVNNITHREIARTLSLTCFKHTPPLVYYDNHKNNDMLDERTFMCPIISMNIDGTTASFSYVTFNIEDYLKTPSIHFEKSKKGYY